MCLETRQSHRTNLHLLLLNCSNLACASVLGWGPPRNSNTVSSHSRLSFRMCRTLSLSSTILFCCFLVVSSFLLRRSFFWFSWDKLLALWRCSCEMPAGRRTGLSFSSKSIGKPRFSNTSSGTAESPTASIWWPAGPNFASPRCIRIQTHCRGLVLVECSECGLQLEEQSLEEQSLVGK